jgi:hypothetical protein
MTDLPAFPPPPSDPDLASDFTALLTHSVHMAGDRLQKFNTFFPFGAAMTPAGQLEQVDAYDGEERPPIREMLDTIAGAFVAGLRSSRYRATALCMNVRCPSENESSEIDALRVHMVHRCGHDVHFFVPYSRTTAGYTFERPFTRKA